MTATHPSADAVAAYLRDLQNRICTALEKAGGNQTAAARLLGVSRDTLRYRVEKFGL